MKKQITYYVIIALGVLLVGWGVYTPNLYKLDYGQKKFPKPINVPVIRQPKQTQTKSTDMPKWTITQIEGQDFTFWPRNFSMTVLPEWKQISPDTVTLPKAFSGPKFVFQKNNTACTFAYFSTATSTRRQYQQISFAQRVFTYGNTQLDSSYYLVKDSIPHGFTFQFHQKQSLPGEVRIIYYPQMYGGDETVYVFTLFSSDGSTVPDDCDHDFSLMMGSIVQKYEKTKVTKNSTGIAYFKREVNNAPPFSLYFQSDEDSISRIVMGSDMDENPAPQVYKEKLYYTWSGDLYTLDIFTEERLRVFKSPPLKDEVINSLFIFNDTAYYLLGNKSCNEYMGACNTTLWEYGVTDKTSTKLADNLTYRSILGYDATRKVLFLTYSDGDAGCGFAKNAEYDFTLGQITHIETLTGCSEDTSTTTKKYNDYFAQFKKQTYIKNFIQIKDGIIVPPSPSRTTPVATWKYVRYVNEE